MLSNSLRLLIAGFTMGWGPCLAYTAPLLLPYIGATKRNWQDGLKVGLVFSIGRLLALAILGGLATIAFSSINRFFPPQKSGWLYLMVAFFMTTMGILIILGKGFKMHIGKTILDKGTISIFLFGFLMGIAPCVPYVAILTYIACVAENAVLAGILYAALFAVGTALAPIHAVHSVIRSCTNYFVNLPSSFDVESLCTFFSSHPVFSTSRMSNSGT